MGALAEYGMQEECACTINIALHYEYSTMLTDQLNNKRIVIIINLIASGNTTYYGN